MMLMRRLLLTSAVFLWLACSALGYQSAQETKPDASRQSFHITPLKPVDELRRDALQAQPPAEPDKRKSDLVEVARLDRTIKLDIRYASDNNFMATPFYSQARAFLQRPAAQSLIAANRELRKHGYGILIHDAYRPWYVTKMFWDATPDDKKKFVANPAKGSMHNRGCAADVSLYDMKTGKEVAMPSGYDEMSERAYPDYAGGTAGERTRRGLLREVMEMNKFTVYEFEWWHFDYENCTSWPIGNVPFEKLNSAGK
jgi:D-alanyl-D-alanine dipeptidase